MLSRQLKVKVLDGPAAGEINKFGTEPVRRTPSSGVVAQTSTRATGEDAGSLGKNKNTDTEPGGQPPSKKHKQATVPEMWADAASLFGDLEGLPQ